MNDCCPEPINPCPCCSDLKPAWVIFYEETPDGPLTTKAFVSAGDLWLDVTPPADEL